MSMTEKRAYLLTWEKVAEVVCREIENILGVHFPGLAEMADGGYWGLGFQDQMMPLSQVYRLLEEVDPPEDVWEDALPDGKERKVRGLGMMLPECLMQRNLSLTWEHTLITPEGLWLVGVEDTRNA